MELYDQDAEKNRLLSEASVSEPEEFGPMAKFLTMLLAIGLSWLIVLLIVAATIKIGQWVF